MKMFHRAYAFPYTEVGLNRNYRLDATPDVTQMLRPPIEITVDEIIGMAQALDYIVALISSDDVVATFAAAGLPLMHGIVNRLKNVRFPGISPCDGTWVTALQQRLFLLPSLTWECPASPPKETFTKWLAENALRDVVITDTVISGSGIDLIQKTIEDIALRGGLLPRSIRIYGVFDQSRGKPQPLNRSFALNQTLVSIDIVAVPYLISETVKRLLGYQSRRTKLGLKPEWLPAVFIIRRQDGFALVVGSRPLNMLWDFVDNPGSLLAAPFRHPSRIPQDAWDIYSFLVMHLQDAGMDEAAEVVQDDNTRLGDQTHINRTKEIEGKVRFLRGKLEALLDASQKVDPSKWQAFVASLPKDEP